MFNFPDRKSWGFCNKCPRSHDMDIHIQANKNEKVAPYSQGKSIRRGKWPTHLTRISGKRKMVLSMMSRSCCRIIRLFQTSAEPLVEHNYAKRCLFSKEMAVENRANYAAYDKAWGCELKLYVLHTLASQNVVVNTKKKQRVVPRHDIRSSKVSPIMIQRSNQKRSIYMNLESPLAIRNHTWTALLVSCCLTSTLGRVRVARLCVVGATVLQPNNSSWRTPIQAKKMSDSDTSSVGSSEASETETVVRVPVSPEELAESEKFKAQANKKFQENHYNDAIDLYSK